MSLSARHLAEVWNQARIAPWTKYSDAEIEQLAALRRLYQKHFHCVLEVVEPMKKDKAKATKNIAAGAVAGAAVGGITGEIAGLATPGVGLIPGVAHSEMIVGAGAGALVGGGVMALREKARSTPDHPQEQLWRGDVEALLLVDKKGYPVLKESFAREKLDNMGELVSSNSLAYNVNSILLHIQRYIHHDRVSGVIKKMAFKENDPRCILCMVIVEWLHKELIPCPEVDRESRLLGQLDAWIKFMKDISAHNVFSTAEAKSDKGWATMDALLLNIDQQFQQMRFYIEAEVRERSIAEQLRGISNTGKTLVSRLFQFITYVLCADDRVPPFFGIHAFYQTIKRPDLVKFVRGCPHGRLLAEIAQALEVQEYLDVWPEDNASDPYSLHTPMDPKQAAIIEGLLYVVHKQQLPQDTDADAVVRLKAVSSLFFAERNAILAFLRLHVQLPVLTRLLLACKEAAFLAGAFGELMFLRNDNSRKILEFLIEGTLTLCGSMKDSLNELWQKASNCRQRQRVDRSGTSEFEKWEENWQQAYRIYNGMGTDNDIGQQFDQILKELTRVQTKLRNPAANLPQVKARMNQFVQLLDGVRSSCPWLQVDDELKGLIKTQATQLNAQQSDALVRAHSDRMLAIKGKGQSPSSKPSDDQDGTYTLEMALKESLACEVNTRAKLERDLAALQRLMADRTAEWDREKRRLNDYIARLTSDRAQAAPSNGIPNAFPSPLEKPAERSSRPPTHRTSSPSPQKKSKSFDLTNDPATPMIPESPSKSPNDNNRSRSRSPMRDDWKSFGNKMKSAAKSLGTTSISRSKSER